MHRRGFEEALRHGGESKKTGVENMGMGEATTGVPQGQRVEETVDTQGTVVEEIVSGGKEDKSEEGPIEGDFGTLNDMKNQNGAATSNREAIGMVRASLRRISDGAMKIISGKEEEEGCHEVRERGKQELTHRGVNNRRNIVPTKKNGNMTWRRGGEGSRKALFRFLSTTYRDRWIGNGFANYLIKLVGLWISICRENTEKTHRLLSHL